MHLSDFFLWLYQSRFGTVIREGGLWFPLIESVHVLALTIVVGSISVVDLRLLGIASTKRSVSGLLAEILPVTWIAFAIALLSGASLFASHAVGYAANLQFRAKMLLLLCAGINMLSFHWAMRHRTAAWNAAGVTPTPGKVAGLISLALWIGIVAFGRWIGFRDVP